MRTRYEEDGTTKGIGEIDNLPGSSQVAVFHSAFVLPQYRKTGVGFAAHRDRILKAMSHGYDYGLVTINMTNEAQISIVKKAGWRLLAEFYSRKTGHIVGIFGKDLLEEMK